jgi:hypothetical protein
MVALVAGLIELLAPVTARVLGSVDDVVFYGSGLELVGCAQEWLLVLLLEQHGLLLTELLHLLKETLFVVWELVGVHLIRRVKIQKIIIKNEC